MSKKAVVEKHKEPESAKSTDPANAVPFAPVANDGTVHTVMPDLSGETVTMVFPRKVHLTVDHHRKIEFKPGIQEVPEEYADHDWLKQNGVLRHEK